MAAQIDAALLRAVSIPQCEISPLITDHLVRRRICLPARHKGLGPRNRTELAPRAWSASFIKAAELFVHDGAVKYGFFVGLTDLFGDGAFVKDGHSFATFLQSAVPYARALERAWDGERSRLGLNTWDLAMPLPKGPLSIPMDRAGDREEGGQSLQHAICEQAETYDAKHLDLELKALPRLRIRGKTMPDPRTTSWTEADKVSRGFAYDYPLPAWPLPA